MIELILSSFFILITGWACGDALTKCYIVIKRWKEQPSIRVLGIRIMLFLLSYALFLYLFWKYR